MAKFWRLEMLNRFRFGGQDLITNPNPNIIRLTKNYESESVYSLTTLVWMQNLFITSFCLWKASTYNTLGSFDL